MIVTTAPLELLETDAPADVEAPDELDELKVEAAAALVEDELPAAAALLEAVLPLDVEPLAMLPLEALLDAASVEPVVFDEDVALFDVEVELPEGAAAPDELELDEVTVAVFAPLEVIPPELVAERVAGAAELEADVELAPEVPAEVIEEVPELTPAEAVVELLVEATAPELEPLGLAPEQPPATRSMVAPSRRS